MRTLFQNVNNSAVGDIIIVKLLYILLNYYIQLLYTNYYIIIVKIIVEIKKDGILQRQLLGISHYAYVLQKLLQKVFYQFDIQQIADKVAGFNCKFFGLEYLEMNTLQNI